MGLFLPFTIFSLLCLAPALRSVPGVWLGNSMEWALYMRSAENGDRAA